MGCWCETCGVTQLPINASDRVRLFILESQPFGRENGTVSGGGTCYPTDLWAPLGPAIQGTYDDYGGIENVIENEDTELLLTRIKEKWTPFEEPYEEVSDLKVMPLKEAVHWIERNNVKSLGIMFVLEEVYQAMLSYDPIEAHQYQTRHWRYKPYSQILQAKFEDWYHSTLFKLGFIDVMSEDLLDAWMGLGIFVSYRELGLKEHQHQLVELAKQAVPLEDERVQKLGASVVELLRFEHSFALARKMWHPQSGKGSQNNELKIYEVLNQATSHVFKARYEELAAYAIEYGEEDEYEMFDTPGENGYYPYMLDHNLQDRALLLEENMPGFSSEGVDDRTSYD